MVKGKREVRTSLKADQQSEVIGRKSVQHRKGGLW